MKLALLADIHANHLALQAVLKAASMDGIEELIIAGDHVGYYFHPCEVFESLDGWHKQMIRGNHEDRLSEAMQSLDSLEEYSKRYGTGVHVAMDELPEHVIENLTSLPDTLRIERDQVRFLISHGSPWDINQYIYPDSTDELFEQCTEDGIDIVITGHTHYQLVRKFGNTVIVNPGSVGQARDRIPGAAWAVFDTETCKVELRREEYDVQSVAREARQRHPDMPYLSEVLLRH